MTFLEKCHFWDSVQFRLLYIPILAELSLLTSIMSLFEAENTEKVTEMSISDVIYRHFQLGNYR